MEVYSARAPLPAVARSAQGSLYDTEYAEKYGLGSREYELVDVFPLKKVERVALPYTPAN